MSLRRKGTLGLVGRTCVAAGLFALAVSSVPALAQDAGGRRGPVVTPAVQVTNDIRPARSHGYQQVLVSPKDENTLVIIESDLTDSAGDCPVHVSLDGGRTWATREAQPKPDQYGSCTRPTFGPPIDAQFGPDGTLYFIGSGSETAANRGPTDVYVARSTDLGATWSFTTVVRGENEFEFTKADGTKQKDKGRYNRLRMAVHPSDPSRVYAGIMISSGTPGVENLPLRSLVAVSTNGGREFGPPVDIFAEVPHDQIFGSDVPSIAVDRDGVIYAVTKERPPAPPPSPATPPPPTPPAAPGGIGVTTPTTTSTVPEVKGAGCPATPQGPPPSPPTTQKPPETPPVLGQAGAGDRLLFAKSTDDGKTWDGRSIEDTVAVCRFCLTTPEAAVDPATGNLYVVFEASDTAPPTPRDDRNIWFMASRDKGKTFSERRQLNDDVDPERKPNYDQLFPGISVAPNGRIDVAWHDFRTDAAFNPEGRGYSDGSGETCWDVFYTSSVDGGRTWARHNVRVSDRSMNKDEGYALNDDYDVRSPLGVASTDRAAYVAWPDSRAGHPLVPSDDTYFASIVHEREAAADEPTVKASSVGLGLAIGLLVAGIAAIAGAAAVRRSSENRDARSKGPAS